MIKKKPLLILLFLIINIPLFSQTFRKIRNYETDGTNELLYKMKKLTETVKMKRNFIEGFEIIRPSFTLTLEKGSLYFEDDDFINGLYFEGIAFITFSIEDEVESSRLEKALKKRRLSREPIKNVYIIPLGTCPDIPKNKEFFEVVPAPENLSSLKNYLKREGIKWLSYLINKRVFDYNDILIIFELNKEIFAYELNHNLENEVRFLRFSHPINSNYYMWDPILSMHLTKENKLTKYISEEEYQEKVLTDVKSYQINYELDSSGKIINGEVEISLEILKPLKAILFEIHPLFKIKKVLDSEKELPFIKEDFSKTYSYYETYLLVDLKEETSYNKKLKFLLQGDLFDKAQGYIYPVEEDLWFPYLYDLDGFMCSFKAIVPKDFEVIASLDLIEHVSKPDHEIFIFKNSIPFKNISFTIGKFNHAKIETQNGILLDVAIPNDLRTNIFSQNQKYTLNELKKIVEFYSNLFGELPYKNIKVTITPYSYGRSYKWRGFETEKRRGEQRFHIDDLMPVPIGSQYRPKQKEVYIDPYKLSLYGRGFPTMIFLTENAFLRKGESEPDRLLAHQVALNWWDGVVSPLSERDVWLSEGLSEFCALMYIRFRFGDEIAKIFRENILLGGMLIKRGNYGVSVDIENYPENDIFTRTEKLGFSGAETKSFEDAPICLGTRVYSTLSSDPERSYEFIIYHKSAFVFGMLENISKYTVEKEIGFYNALKNIIKKYNGKRISTPTFIKELENSIKIPLQNYFNGWLESTDFPRVEIKTFIEKKENEVNIRASGKSSSNLFLAVPIRVKLKEKRYNDYLLLFENKVAQNEWKIKEDVKSVEIDPLRIVFCSYGRVK